MRTPFIIFILTLLLIPYQLKADKHLSTHNGLSNKRTFCIEKDENGFIWIATRTGVDRYDGTHIKQYKLQDSATQVDIAGRINMLAKDKKNGLWAFTNNGEIFKYDERKDHFSLKVNLSEKTDFNDLFLNGMRFSDNDNILLYGSFGVWFSTPEFKDFHKSEYFKGKTVATLLEMDNSRFAVGTYHDLVTLSFHLTENNLTEKDIETAGLNERVQCLYLEKFDNSLTLGTFSGKLMFYNLAEKRLEDTHYHFKASVRDIKSYDNTLYIATDGGGLVRVNRDNKKIQNIYSHFENEIYKDSPYAIYNILIDDNRLWLATYTNGVYLYDDNLPAFRLIQPEGSATKHDNAINSILEDSSGNLWFGTNDGISHLNHKTGKWTHLFHEVNGGTHRYNIMALCEDNETNVWAGGVLGTPAICIDSKTLKVKDNLTFAKRSESSAISRTYCIFNDSEGNLWMGGLHSPLIKYNLQTKKYTQYKLNHINTVVEKNKTITVGTTQGLYILDKNTDTFKQVLDNKKTKSVMSSFINTIYEDANGILWLGTEYSLLKYDRENDSIHIYKKEFPSSVFTILPDARNRLWIGTETGLVCFDSEQEETINFGTEEGLMDERFKARSAIKKQNGEILMGTTSGAICFTPELIDRLSIKNKLIITDFYISNRPVYPGEKNSPLTTVIDESQSIRLKYNNDTFSFQFTSINFTNPHRARFEWKLEGYDKEWVQQENINRAYYTNVHPGEYVFKLRLVNKDNQQEIASKSIDIRIDPPFWQTTVAKVIYLILFFILLWIIIQFIRIRMEKASSTEKLNFFTHTAHELKTPITLIKGPLNKMQDSTDLSDDDKILLDMAVNNTHRLYKLVTQLLDIQKTGNKSAGLLVSKHELSEYVRERVSSFRQAALNKNIQLTIETLDHPLEIYFDTDKMDKIIYNLLSNAIKYTLANGKIIVSINENKKSWWIEVKDNGIGIPKKAQKNMFKPFFRAENAIKSTEGGTGIGMVLTRNLVEMHGGTLTFESAEGKGSSFKIMFPSTISHLKNVNYELSEESENPKEDEEIEQTPESTHLASILVVEDNEELRLLLKHTLSGKYQVHLAVNGIEASEIVKKINPELIISDIMMPEMDGYEFCKHIKSNKETSHIPVILLTALDDKENVIKGYEYGADNYITKPFDASILKKTVDNTITTRQALRKNLILPIEQDIQEELTTNPLDKAFMDEVMSIIEKNLDDSEFSIDNLCREIGMSRTSFFNKIKALTEQSPNEFIRFVRLNKAAKMLKEQKYGVAEVAYSTGFGDVKYFSTIFKKHFGVSPSKFIDR